jgi:hypothetical protein
MARTETADDLRSCPTCGTAVAHTQLGLRDYSRWLADVLPGRVSGSDIDSVVEQSKTGRFLALEFKPLGAILPTGQRLLLKALVRRDIDVWVCWEDFKGHVEVGSMNRDGEILFVEKMTEAALGRKVAKWWNAGLQDG